MVYWPKRAPVCLVAAAALVLSGCASDKVEPPDQASRDMARGMGKFRTQAPGASGWKKLQTLDEVRYVISPEKQFDEDIISVYARLLPVGEGIADEAALHAFILSKGDPSIDFLEPDELLGRPVVHFRRYVLDTAGNPADVTQVLRLRGRPAGEYYIRGEGIYLLDPEHPTRALELGVERNSFHGMIGPAYREKGEAFIDNFLLNNGLLGAAQEDLSLGPQD